VIDATFFAKQPITVFMAGSMTSSWAMQAWLRPGGMFAFAMLLVSLPCSEGVFTKVKQGQQKCFIELLHANLVVAVQVRIRRAGGDFCLRLAYAL